MRITIFGASGGTGKHLVQQALAAGHEVTAFVRTPAKLNVQHACLRIVQGDVIDAAAVEQAVKGAEAVVSVLNTRLGAKGRPITEGARNILAAMHKFGVRRLVFSAAPSARFPQDAPDLRFRVMIGLVRLIARSGAEDMIGSVEAVRASDVDWEIVRLSFPAEGPKTGQVKVGYLDKQTGMRISRADAAAFILQELQEAKYLRQAPVISN